MPVEIRMPKMGLTMSTAEVAKWLKKEGEAVARGEAVAEVMTDKLTNQLESPADGILLKIVAPAGSQLEAGGLMAFLGQAGESVPEVGSSASAAPAQEAAPAASASSAAPGACPSGGRVFISPLARKIAKEHGLDYTGLTGTGPGGRIVRADIEKAIQSGYAPAQAAAAPAGLEVLETVPYAGMRQAIGRNMLKSWTEIPSVTQNTSVTVDKLLALRKQINQGLEATEKISLTALLVKIAARAVAAKPAINSHFNGRELQIMKDVNIGVAVALDGGLIVPTIRKVHEKSMTAINKELIALVDKARFGGLGPDDLSGATLTITNLGGYVSVDHFSPIINPPQVAIIGVGRSKQAPVVVDGEVAVATIMGLSITHDHRVLDGAPVAEYLAEFIRLIEEPLTALM